MDTDVDIEKPTISERGVQLSILFPDNWRRLFFTGLILTVLSIIHVLVGMQVRGVYGFSFDDSWIHVQYARSIFEGTPWEYSTDIPSTGSSAPLWSVILIPIFLFGYARDTIVTSVLVISSLFYIVDTFLVGELVKQHTKRWQSGVLAQAVFILVPRNAGLMLSGMETPLGMLMFLLALYLLPKEDMKYDPVLGLIAGLAYLCRPEFVLIAALCFPIRAIYLLYKDRLNPKRVLSILSMFALAVVVVAPWVLHCLNTTGLPLPDSYYSKMRWGVTEEAVAIWRFFWFIVWIPLEPYLLLGFLAGIVLAAKGHPFEGIMSISLFVLYETTMPATALLFAARYIVPLFDLLAISFVSGGTIFLNWFLGWRQERKSAMLVFIVASSCMLFIYSFLVYAYSLSFMAILAIVIVVFLYIIKKPAENEKHVYIFLIIVILFFPSLESYNFHIDIHARQTENISTMQVYLAQWASAELPENATIATYDVGAIGYFFYPRTVIDLYGLVTPKILHNLTSLIDVVLWLKELDCNYIMFYVEWMVGYTWALRNVGAATIELERAHLDDNVVCGTDNMSIYEIDWDYYS